MKFYRRGLMHRGSRAAIAGLVVSSMLMAGCGSDDDTSSSTTTITVSGGVTTTSEAGPDTTMSATTTTLVDPTVVADSSRGFDGKTIKIGGLNTASLFAGTDIGAEARIKRANDTDELDGIKIEFVGMADDKFDPAVALTEARRLVTSENVFAIVPASSPVIPGAYLTEEKVPFIGWGITNDFCSTTPSTDLWGFGYAGCGVPSDPPTMPDTYGKLYDYISEKTGKTNPTVVMFSNDSTAGKNTTKFQASAAAGAGFDVLYAKGEFPDTTSDFTPYIQKWITADDGHAPDLIACLASIRCIPIWAALKTAGYAGAFSSPLGNLPALNEALAGTYASSPTNTADTPGLEQLKKDLEAFKPGTVPSVSSNMVGYFAVDMFIEAVKQLGTNITAENLQKVMARQTWEIEGFAGPITYPDATVGASPFCNSLLHYKEDKSGVEVLTPYSCNTVTHPVDSKFDD
jgi:branched-chain amino acid transport system substrate-binding protein